MTNPPGWGLDGAEAILILRAVISDGGYPDEYWSFHLKREHQRLYGGIKQGQYTLGAWLACSLQVSYTYPRLRCGLWVWHPWFIATLSCGPCR